MDQPSGGHAAGDSIVLEEEIDQNYVPSEDEVREYAKWLGMELEEDLDLFWIAKEGLKAPLPENWKPCKTVDTDEIYYFNFATGESTWDHPCDEYYRKLYEEEKKKKVTKDKAKHDKSKQQAKKDVSQLLGRDKKKKSSKSRPPKGKEGPAHHHQPSPERIQVAPLAASSIFDRKPLPGIGRQSSQGGDTHAFNPQASTSSPTQSDKAFAASDKSPSRTQANSLVGHRRSRHLPVSVGSEDEIERPEDEVKRPEDDSTRPSAVRGPVRSREEDAILHSQHAAMLTELRKEHARDLDALKQAQSDTKQQLEADHRRNIANTKRQWAASVEAQSKKARDAMKHELQLARANHSREIEKLERSLLDAKARLKKAIDETEEASEAVHTKKTTLESALAEVEQQVLEERKCLREAREATRKVQAAQAAQPDRELRRELAQVVLELENERKHVAELQGLVKEANSAIEDDSNNARPDGDSVGSKIILLEEKLALAIRENEGLRREAARATVSESSGRVGGRLGHEDDEGEAWHTPMSASESESKATKEEHTEVITLKKALHETEMKFLEVQRARDQSVQDAKDAAAALMAVQATVASVELDNSRLVEQIANYHEQDAARGEALNIAGGTLLREHIDTPHGQDAGTQTELIGEHEGDASTSPREAEDFRADLEAARREVARFAGEVHKSKELESVVRDELHAAQLALRESQLKIAELNESLANAGHEKKLSNATAQELRLEIARLKHNMETLRSPPQRERERDASAALADTLKNELKELKAQLAAMALERDGLNDEVGELRQKLVRFEGVLKAERGMFDSSIASQQRQSESLQTTVKRLEAEILAGQRREEALHTAARQLRENMTASKLEIRTLQETLRETTTETERVASDPPDAAGANPETLRSSSQIGGYETESVSAADLERATAATREMTSRLQLAEEQVNRLRGSLEEMTSELTESQSVTASLQEELAKTKKNEKDTTQQLEEALSRCANAEESLAQARDDRMSLELALGDAEHPSVNDKQYCDLERALLQSQGDLESAKADLTSSKQQVVDLQQNLADLSAGANMAIQEVTQEVQHNRELMSACQKGIVSVSEREQEAGGKMLQARISLSNFEKDRERALVAAEQSKRDLAHAESGWRQEAADLKIDLKKTSATACGQGENSGRSAVRQQASQQSPPPNEPQHTSPPQPEVAVDEGPHLTMRGASDATSGGLAEEIMQKLTEEENQRHGTGPAITDNVSRSWTKKLNEEREMLAQAKDAMIHHKDMVKRRQQRLLLCQTRWRDQRLSAEVPPTKVRTHYSTRHRSLEDSKRDLDSEVYKLNRFVKQLRSCKRWLDQRERKVSDFEKLLAVDDASGLEPRSVPHPSGTTCSGEKSSPTESSNSSRTAKLRSLEAMQQELDKDFSDLTADSSIHADSSILGFSRPLPMHGDRKPRRSQRQASKQGKENALPGSIPVFPVGYPPYSPFPPPPGFWVHPAHAYLGEFPRSPLGVPYRSRTSRPAPSANRRDRGLGSGVQATVDGIQECSESDLQRWLNRQNLGMGDIARDGNGIAARERREHFAKWSVEGKQAQSAVALHVDWLNTLRKEMGLLGTNAIKPPRSAPVAAQFAQDI